MLRVKCMSSRSSLCSALLSVASLFSVRAPTADLPNNAALLGGLVAQEVIKVITKQYIPINGYCVIDMIDMSTAIL